MKKFKLWKTSSPTALSWSEAIEFAIEYHLNLDLLPEEEEEDEDEDSEDDEEIKGEK